MQFEVTGPKRSDYPDTEEGNAALARESREIRIKEHERLRALELPDDDLQDCWQNFAVALNTHAAQLAAGIYHPDGWDAFAAERRRTILKDLMRRSIGFLSTSCKVDRAIVEEVFDDEESPDKEDGHGVVTGTESV